MLNEFAFVDPKNETIESFEQKVLNVANRFPTIVEPNEKDSLITESRRFHLDYVVTDKLFKDDSDICKFANICKDIKRG